MADQQP